MATKADITAELLCSMLDYDPETGIFVWRDRPGSDHQTNAWRAKFAGKVAGSLNRGGYIDIGFWVEGVRVRNYAHRLAWLYVHGVWPEEHIDHIDGNRTNNRIANLRPATAAQNAHNTGARSWSKSGIKGVTWDRERRKWFVSIFVNRKQIALGRYDTQEEAAAAYAEAARKYHGEFANTGE